MALACALAVAGCAGDDESSSDLAFVSSRDGDYAVFVMAANGGGERRLTEGDDELREGESPFFQIEPAWSADGTKIAFVSGRSGSADIFVMEADGSGTRRLTATKQNDSHPTWEPSGERIAFARDGEIYVVNAAGGGERKISDVLVEESEPSWSPDGDWIAYVRRTPGTAIQNVWVMRADGSGRRALTRQDGRAFTPAWSPDSARIVYATNAETDKTYELFTVGLDGKGLRRVAPTAGDNFEPSWSPDGSRIAYQEAGAIFTVELGGGDVEKLTDGANNDSSPAWNPQPPSDVAQNVPKRSYASSGGVPSRTAARISPSVAAFCSASARTSSATACGITTTPSSSPTTQSPGSTRTRPMRIGTCVASSSHRHVESSGVT